MHSIFFIIEDALPLFNYFHIAFIYFLKDTTSTSQQVKKTEPLAHCTLLELLDHFISKEKNLAPRLYKQQL